jgi:hypothetical protein
MTPSDTIAGMVRIGSVAVGLVLVLASGAIGCRGDLAPQSQGTAGSDGTGSGGAGATGTSGTTGTGLGPCDQDLSGTWDVIATNPGSPTGTMAWEMTIDPNTFSFSNASGSLVYHYNPDATRQLAWTTPSRTQPINVSVTPGALDAGSLRLALGGAWTLSANGETCSVSVTSMEMLATCQGPGPYVGSSNWPYPLPSPMHGRQYTARRNPGMPLPSQLGELSGLWYLTNGSTGSCSVDVYANTIAATCDGNAQPLTGSLRLALNGTDCVASGTSGRYELSARRR